MANGEMVKFSEEFAERVKPKKAEAAKLFLFTCECGGRHFRHAGYVEALMPFIRANGEKRVSDDDYAVKVCVACRRSYIWMEEQMYEVTDLIDLEAWAKAERELHAATGPGGNC